MYLRYLYYIVCIIHIVLALYLTFIRKVLFGGDRDRVENISQSCWKTKLNPTSLSIWEEKKKTKNIY